MKGVPGIKGEPVPPADGFSCATFSAPLQPEQWAAELYFAKADATIRSVQASQLQSSAEGDSMSDRDSNGFLWFLAGLGIGALAGVLYAPQSGSETRDVIRGKAEEGRERVRARARQAREQAAEWTERGKDVLNQQKEQFRSAFEAGKQAYRETTTDPGTTKSV
jgi:gas vesicle protein